MKLSGRKNYGLVGVQVFLILSLSFAISIALDNSYVGIGSAGVFGGSNTPVPSKIITGVQHEAGFVAVPSDQIGSGATRLFQNSKTGKIYSSDPASKTILGHEFIGGSAHLVQGLQWGLFVVGAIQLIGNVAGIDQDTTNTLSIAAFGGIMAGKGIASLGPGGFEQFGSGSFLNSGTAQFGIGLAVAAIIFIALYKDKSTETVSFVCLPWEPALGGSQCDVCGKDDLPCSEYRCKSLGQACGLVNEGSIEEACVWISPNDVTSPTITPVVRDLEPVGLAYTPLKTRPDGIGTRIEPLGGGCLESFSRLQFGFENNEVAQCKMDWNRVDFSEMRFPVGGSNNFLLNHTQEMSLPNPADEVGSANPIFENGGEFSLYMQCQDANGNKNEDHFIWEYCVDDSPDTTAPRIDGTSIVEGSPVQYQISEVELDIYINEEASCKWSRDDKPFDDMEHTMVCPGTIEQINANPVYPCQATLTGAIDREENQYYFRCKDDDGNTNVESYPFMIRGSQPLNILSISPNQTEVIVGSTETVKVDLLVETDDGADDGAAICLYNSTLTDGYRPMFESDSFQHKQTQDLPAGIYDYNFQCTDAGGNVAEESVQFEVEVDINAPRVVRVYRDTALKIVTNEDAACSYSLQDCNFEFTEGTSLEYSNIDRKTELFAPWVEGNKYHVKCTDDFGNQPLPNSCSVIVSPRSLGVN